jgi:hypothetical protein
MGGLVGLGSQEDCCFLRPQPEEAATAMKRHVVVQTTIMAPGSPASTNSSKCRSGLMHMYVQAHRLLRARRNARFSSCPSSEDGHVTGHDVCSFKTLRCALRRSQRAERQKTIDAITVLAAGWLTRHGFVGQDIDEAGAADNNDGAGFVKSGVFAGQFRDYYALGKVLGEGSCAEVRECFVAQGDKLQTAESDAVYAVKILKRNKARRKHMQNEITALTRAQHPHCIKLVDVYMEDEIYIVMELLTGGTVLDRIIETDCYSEADARNVTSQVQFNNLHVKIITIIIIMLVGIVIITTVVIITIIGAGGVGLPSQHGHCSP